MFGFGDSVAPPVKEIALLPAVSETENGFKNYNKTNLDVSLSVSVFAKDPRSHCRGRAG